MKKTIQKILTCLVLSALLLTGCREGSFWDQLDDNYMFQVNDAEGNGVEGVTLQICNGNMCTTVTTDDTGATTYDGDYAKYEVKVLSYPEGYYFNPHEVIVTEDGPQYIKITLEYASAEEVSIAEATEVTEKDNEVDTEEVSDTSDENAEENDEETTEEDKTSSDNNVSSDGSAKQDASQAEAYEEASSNNTNTGSEKTEEVKQASSPFGTKQIDVPRSGNQISFSGTDYYGNAIDSSILANYDITLINLWEPWCGPCVNEMPEFQKAYELAQRSGIKFNIIGFYSSTNGASSVINNIGITYPIVYDNGYFGSYQTGYVPTNFFVDSEGYVLPITQEEMGLFLYNYYSGYFNSIDEANSEAKDYVYSKGQTSTMTKEMLYQFIANRQ